MQKKIVRYLLFLFMIVWIITGNCSNPSNPGTPYSNTLPETRLSNIPVNDSLGRYPASSPTVALYWIGDDPDGFVTAFRYRWSYREHGVTIYNDWKTILNLTVSGVVMLVKGSIASVPKIYNYFATLPPGSVDSVVTKLTYGKAIYVEGDTVLSADPKQIENPHKGVFIFESKDTLNPHTFEVKAVDNEAAEDPTPASVTFWTPKALPPDTRVIPPYPADSSFLIDRITDTFSGLKFYFEGIDPYSKGLEYSWSVDSLKWSPFSSEQSATVTAADLKPPYTRTHTFYVKARNDYALEDSTPASYKFTVVVPVFIDPAQPHKILLLNDTRNGSGNKGDPNSLQLNSFYSALLDSLGKIGKYDAWTVKTQGFPKRTTLGNYSTVVLYNDNYLGDLAVKISSDRAQLLSEYLTVGGKLIVSGWQLPLAFDNPDSFFVNRIHVYTVSFNQPNYYLVNYNRDFIGAYGQNGYPDFLLDTTKMPQAWGGALSRMAVISPRGFAEVIYLFNSKSDSVLFEKRTLGIRYLGITYSVIYFGFPLYYVDQRTAVATLRKAFQDIGE